MLKVHCAHKVPANDICSSSVCVVERIQPRPKSRVLALHLPPSESALGATRGSALTHPRAWLWLWGCVCVARAA